MMRSLLFRVSLILLAQLCLLAITGCTSLAVNVTEGTPLPKLLEDSKKSESVNYRIEAGDQLTVRFYFNPQLDEEIQVRPDGMISLSLIGELGAAGSSPKQLSDAITDAYSKFFAKATAVVIVRQFTFQRVFVSGEVKIPGQYSILNGARTVLQSIAVSGGATNDATLTKVILVRKLPGQTQPAVTELDLTRALSGADASQDVALLPDDLIYVPKSGIADFNLALKQYFYNIFNLNVGAQVLIR